MSGKRGATTASRSRAGAWLLVALLGACAGGDAPPRAPPDTVARISPDGDERAPAADTTGDTEPADDCSVAPLGPRPGSRVIQVFYSCAGAVRPVERYVPDTPAVLRGTLDALLAGPTDEELLAGFFSWFNRETAGMVESVGMRDGVADISFQDFSSLVPGASSSAGSEQLLEQLRATIFQFPDVREARLSFHGDCDAFWNWLQRGCEALRPHAAREEA